ncbi:hypothetical protein PCO31110_02906 [Pandoraea communis]|uniref:Lipoprotein n=1 Tax=Pandoraea communis TaxID=2508297 RepID=A0A5E4VXY7_9BURK|nr:hypothetical protein [Pandoraea communis]VVE15725.1 hypothetical protein PCO31110_02906 [Pandoraea communis]
MYEKADHRKSRIYLTFIGFLIASSVHASGEGNDRPHLNPKDAFFSNTVYVVGPSMERCAPINSGVPANLWGNRERVEQTETISQDGRLVTITGRHEDGAESVFRFFLRRDECLAFSRKPISRSSDSLPQTTPIKVIGIFPGNAHIFPITLTNELCVPGKPDDGYRAIARASLLLQSAPTDMEACWNFDNSGRYKPNSVIITCLREQGRRTGRVSGDCRWIDKGRFLDPATIPRSAF